MPQGNRVPIKTFQKLTFLQAALSHLPQGKVLALLVTVQNKMSLINLADAQTKSIHDTVTV
jgi:hypothetical protein